MKALFTAFALLAAALTSQAAAHGHLNPPEGLVVLTVAGNIEETNRGAFDPAADNFLKYHERTFRKAAEFDLPMLEALGTHNIEVVHKTWSDAHTFSGPYLKDVLKAVGWDGEQITTLALDGYGTKIDKATLEKYNWILATRIDGKPIGIGHKGPLWLLFAPPGDRPATDEEEGMWPWAVFYIEAN